MNTPILPHTRRTVNTDQPLYRNSYQTTPAHATLLRQAALAYAARGLYVMPLHEPRFDDAGKCCGCTCELWKRSKRYFEWLRSKGLEKRFDANYTCRTPGKHPRISDWETNASTDPAQINAWWDKWPTANIGVAAGRSGLVTFDRDTYKTVYGDDSALFSHADTQTATQISQNGGEHLVYQMPAGARYTNANNTLPPGIDIRGAGGMFVVEPSIGPSGNQWQWELGYSILEREPLPLPPALAAILDAAQGTGHATPAPSVTFTTTPTTERPDLIRWHISKTIRDSIHTPAPVGQRSEADMRVITALIYAGATDGEILAVFQHYPIGTNGKYAERGAAYLERTIGKARSYVELHPRVDVGATVDRLRLWIKTSSFADHVDPKFFASDGTYRTELTDRRVADAVCDLMQAAGRLDVSTGKKRLGALAGVSCNTAQKSLIRLSGWLFVVEQADHKMAVSLVENRGIWYIDPLIPPNTVYIRDQSTKSHDLNVFSPNKNADPFLAGISKFVTRRVQDLADALEITTATAKALYTIPSAGAGVLLAYDTALRVADSMTAQEYSETAGLKLWTARSQLNKCVSMGLADAHREGYNGPKVYTFTPEFWQRIDELLPNMRTRTSAAQRENRRLESSQIWAQRGMAKAQDNDPEQTQRLERRFAKLARQRLPLLETIYADRGLTPDEIESLAYEVFDYKRTPEQAALIHAQRTQDRDDHRDDVRLIRDLAYDVIKKFADDGLTRPTQRMIRNEVMRFGVFDEQTVNAVIWSQKQMAGYWEVTA